jgi:hypothetical protein
MAHRRTLDLARKLSVEHRDAAPRIRVDRAVERPVHRRRFTTVDLSLPDGSIIQEFVYAAPR